MGTVPTTDPLFDVMYGIAVAVIICYGVWALSTTQPDGIDRWPRFWPKFMRRG